MKTVAVLATLMSSAAAFAPTKEGSQYSTALRAFDSELGVQEPLGFW